MHEASIVWLIPNAEIAAAVKSLDEEMERASDRAVGVLAGSIVEAHLTKFIRQNLHDPGGKVWEQRGHPSGPFGAFAVKIDLAFMVGLITEEARRDLIVLKDIRNRFAHDLTIQGFEEASVAAKCRNLALVDRHISDWEPGVLEKVQAALAKGDLVGAAKLAPIGDRFVVSGAGEELKQPRGRFIWTARLFSFRLGLRGQDHLPPQLGQPAI